MATAVPASVPAEFVKPFLKWVGGKTQILEQVLTKFPSEINDYYEPFLGGGSVLLGLLTRIRQGKISVRGKIYASDINPHLISLYQNIQENPESLLTELRKITSEFSQADSRPTATVNRTPSSIEQALTSRESYYYWTRARYNAVDEDATHSPETSAMLLFLNKTCFRGIYREGPRGFNVPFGNYTNPGIFDEDHIRLISNLIQPVKFTATSYSDALEIQTSPSLGDFVYLDPPYVPETSTSFVSYTADGFSLEDHNALFKLCKSLNERSVKFLLSNSNVSIVKNTFSSPPYETQIILCKRSINSKNPVAKTNEVLIRN